MMDRFIRSITAVLLCVSLVSFTFAQSNSSKPQPSSTEKPAKKPFKILTNGKKVTVQSSRNIKSILVWSASGNRIVEQNDLSVSNFSFETTSKDKIFFLRIELENGKMFTEKIGVQ